MGDKRQFGFSPFAVSWFAGSAGSEGPWALNLTMHQTQFQEEADSVSQTLAKLNSSLDIQYSPAPGGPPTNPTELLRQLEVRWPHPAPEPLSWEWDLPMCLGLTPARYLVLL